MDKPVPPQEKTERRQYERYNVELRMQVIGREMLPLHVHANDLSLAGMHFNCDRWTAQHLMPPGETAVPANAKSFTVRCRLPGNGEKPKTLTLMTKVISVQRLAQDEYRVNMRFERFGGNSQAMLQEYLSTLKPAV